MGVSGDVEIFFSQSSPSIFYLPSLDEHLNWEKKEGTGSRIKGSHTAYQTAGRSVRGPFFNQRFSYRALFFCQVILSGEAVVSGRSEQMAEVHPILGSVLPRSPVPFVLCTSILNVWLIMYFLEKKKCYFFIKNRWCFHLWATSMTRV